MAVGKLIKSLRIQNKMTQVQLAEKAGVSVNTIRLYERDKVEPKVATLQKIAYALNISAYEFLARSGVKDDVRSPRSVGERLARVRKCRNMSKEQLANRANIAVEDLERIEGGTLDAPFELKFDFCRILEMDYRWLECGENTEAHDKMMERFLGPENTFDVETDSEETIRNDILVSFSKLNHDGMLEARKRIAELAQLICYRAKEKSETTSKKELPKNDDSSSVN